MFGRVTSGSWIGGFLPAAAAACVLAALAAAPGARADAAGTIVFTQRFDGTPTIVNELRWTYVRATPSVSFSNQRVIWTGAGAQVGGGAAPCDQRLAGSDGLFYRPDGNLVVGNWEPGTCSLPGQFWIFDPAQTDVVVDGPSDATFAFHMLLHPNLQDFLATPALGGIACGGGTAGCFGVHDHTPLGTSQLCLAPLESDTNDVLQPVTFIADAHNNLFVLYNDGTDVQYGGAGFASFDLSTTNSAACAGNMSMTSLIPPAIEAGHSISWDPYLSDADDPVDPHSDFIVFANSRISHIRVDDPGTPGADANLVSTIDMATEAVCDSLLPAPGQGGQHEFDQGAVTGDGIALVADEHSGYLALVDYRQNTNGTILDGANTVCLVEFMHDGVDDIAPLTGLGAKPALPNFIFLDGFEDLGECIPFQVEACYDGPPETEGVGTCMSGTRTCGGDGVWGACSGWVGPVEEVCGDGQDNDCDTVTDNGCSALECDPLELTSCNANPSVEACFIFGTDATDCAPPGMLEQNEPCQFVNDCTPGLSCVLLNEDNTGNLCTNVCDPDTGVTAAGGNCETLAELTDGRCVALNAYYSNFDLSGIGMCIDCALAKNAAFCP